MKKFLTYDWLYTMKYYPLALLIYLPCCIIFNILTDGLFRSNNFWVNVLVYVLFGALCWEVCIKEKE